MRSKGGWIKRQFEVQLRSRVHTHSFRKFYLRIPPMFNIFIMVIHYIQQRRLGVLLLSTQRCRSNQKGRLQYEGNSTIQDHYVVLNINEEARLLGQNFWYGLYGRLGHVPCSMLANLLCRWSMVQRITRLEKRVYGCCAVMNTLIYGFAEVPLCLEPLGCPLFKCPWKTSLSRIKFNWFRGADLRGSHQRCAENISKAEIQPLFHVQWKANRSISEARHRAHSLSCEM